MKTGKVDKTDQTKDPHKTPYYGSLFDYASDILSAGRGNGSDYCAGAVSPTIINDLSKRGAKLKTENMSITQRQIFKYRNHPKERKGANLPVEDYNFIEQALTSPKNIYVDISKRNLVYVVTTPYRQNKIVKVVMHPNYVNNGKTTNLVKSWGIVKTEDMLAEQYIRIK